MGVWDSQSLDGTVKGEHIGEMSIVEPESRGGYKNSPIGSVFCCGEGGEQRGESEGKLEKVLQPHDEAGGILNQEDGEKEGKNWKRRKCVEVKTVPACDDRCFPLTVVDKVLTRADKD